MEIFFCIFYIDALYFCLSRYIQKLLSQKRKFDTCKPVISNHLDAQYITQWALNTYVLWTSNELLILKKKKNPDNQFGWIKIKFNLLHYMKHNYPLNLHVDMHVVHVFLLFIILDFIDINSFDFSWTFVHNKGNWIIADSVLPTRFCQLKPIVFFNRHT